MSWLADRFDGEEQAMVVGSDLLLVDLVARDVWLDRTPFEQAFIDLEVFNTSSTFAEITVISATMIDTTSE